MIAGINICNYLSSSSIGTYIDYVCEYLFLRFKDGRKFR